jgi:hypothetical protein
LALYPPPPTHPAPSLPRPQRHSPLLVVPPCPPPSSPSSHPPPPTPPHAHATHFSQWSVGSPLCVPCAWGCWTGFVGTRPACVAAPVVLAPWAASVRAPGGLPLAAVAGIGAGVPSLVLLGVLAVLWLRAHKARKPVPAGCVVHPAPWWHLVPCLSTPLRSLVYLSCSVTVALLLLLRLLCVGCCRCCPLPATSLGVLFPPTFFHARVLALTASLSPAHHAPSLFRVAVQEAGVATTLPHPRPARARARARARA